MDGDKLVTDSLTVAKSFGKAQIIGRRAFDNLKCSLEFSRHNFVPHEYVHGRGNIQRMVEMTKDRFVLLVMGLMGEAPMAGLQ